MNRLGRLEVLACIWRSRHLVWPLYMIALCQPIAAYLDSPTLFGIRAYRPFYVSGTREISGREELCLTARCVMRDSIRYIEVQVIQGHAVGRGWM